MLTLNFNPNLFTFPKLTFFRINIFGLFSAIGILVIFFLLVKDPKRKQLISVELLCQLLTEFIIVSIISAKSLFILEHWSLFLQEGLFCAFSRDGFSMMGVFACLPLYAYFRLKSLNINFLTFADLIAAKLPLFQAIARLGCFFVGCCVGNYCYQESSLFCVIYQNPHCLAPLGIALFPLQLVSALCSVIIFFTLNYLQENSNRPKGFIFATYLIMEGGARTIVDFWRLERNNILFFEKSFWSISWPQVLALATLIAGFGLQALICSRLKKHT